jgi:cytochrome c oxidase subunit IV
MATPATAPAPGERLQPQTKLIWRTFWILLIATAIEFVIAFTMAHGLLRVSIFLGLTVVKAFYIVGEFMHLKHETKGLIWCIVLPTVFLMWAVVAFLTEGSSISDARF